MQFGHRLHNALQIMTALYKVCIVLTLSNQRFIILFVLPVQRSELMEGMSIEEQVGHVVGKVGPSMMLTSVSESLAFFLGALTTMPAVRIFSLYAAGAVLFDFLLQITCFISLLTLDAKRQHVSKQSQPRL